MAYLLRKTLPLVCYLLFITATMAQHVAHSVLSDGTWYKMAISKTGVYRLTVADLAALEGQAIDSLALYGQPGGVYAEQNNIARPDDLAPIAVAAYDGNGNGRLDANDYLLFYAEGAGVWRYSQDNERYEYLQHPYATHNFCYLKIGATQHHPIATTEEQIVNSDDITTYTARTMHHNDVMNTHGTGQIWVSDKFGNAIPSRSYPIETPHAVAGRDVRVRYALASVAHGNTQFTVAHGSQSYTHTFEKYTPYQINRNQFTPNSTSPFNFRITYSAPDNRCNGYLDYIELNYTATIVCGTTQTDFRNETTQASRIARFIVGGASSGVKVWDVTNPLWPVAMRTSVSGNQLAFAASINEQHEYIAFTSAQAYTPAAITPIRCQDIHGSASPDMVIVCHPNLLAQGERLAEIHRLYDQMEVQVLTADQVFNEFSSGKQDPMAIREMMRMYWKRDSVETYRHLLLFGKGSFDNRNLNGKNSCTVVTYESPKSFDSEGSSYATDNILGYLHDNERGYVSESMDVSIGRLPAGNEAEATHLVDKIANYVAKIDLADATVRGDWRNYVALLADDADPSRGGDTGFVHSSEITAHLIKSSFPQFNIDRIYADAFVQQSGADGSYYPDANNALKKRIDYGCLLLNYIGHGSPQYIGTERYMQISDIDAYANTNRLTFFVTSTCSFGKYDRPDTLSGAEAFLLAPAAGIGVVAASRPIGHVQRFNTNVCLNALTHGNTIGDALRRAKNATAVSHSTNLLGDPALKLSFPRYNIVVTTINGNPVSESRCDTATTLTRVTVQGEIRDADGTLQDDFNGEIFPIVFDREMKAQTLANDNEHHEVTFTQQKNILYKGRERVNGGRFSYSFIVPKDVAYTYGVGKLSHYARSGNDDACGEYSNILFGGFNPNSDIAETRPSVRLFINDSLFRSGGITDENPSIYAILEDSLGINTAGAGIGHDITALLDNNYNNLFVLNDFYETDINNTHRGTVTYSLNNLSQGWHTLSLKAWNIFNYSASDTLRFYVRTADTAHIGSFYALPNPATTQVSLRAEHNCTITEAAIEIYNLYGQHVRSLTPTIDANSYVAGPVVWDFRNNAGLTVAPGCYIARIILKTEANEQLTATTKIIKL